MLRGDAFKPRTSPYSFQGLGEAGLQLMAEAREEFELPFVAEVLDSRDVDLVSSYADVLRIGTRNMSNFTLLAEVGRQPRPVQLKRGFTATLEEWLNAAEYIYKEGNHQIILVERGIRTFETAARNTLDITAVPLIKGMSHLPIVVDPSHSGGRRELVAPLARAAVAAGADGIMVDVHPDPRHRQGRRRPGSDAGRVRRDDDLGQRDRFGSRPRSLTMPVAALLGTGLIGASIGIGLRGLGWVVVGWDPDEGAGRGAIRCGAVDRLAESVEDAMTGADLVVLAGPPVAIEEQLRTLDTESLVTDVAGVKSPMVDGRATSQALRRRPSDGGSRVIRSGRRLGFPVPGRHLGPHHRQCRPRRSGRRRGNRYGAGGDPGPDGFGRS